MTMNNRKMNSYSLMRISTVFVLTIALVVSTFSISFGPRTRAEPNQNNPPYAPSNPFPENGAINVSVTAVLSWNCSDPDGDPIHYDVYFGNTSPPGLVIQNYTNTTYNQGTMNYSTQYFWRIVAWDNQSLSNESPLWEFTTEKQQQNHPPNTPSHESPTNGAAGVSRDVILSWEGGDPDVGDNVSYDVYFGNSVTQSKVSGNQSNLTFNPDSLGYNTTYYWRIVAWDNHGVSTIGPLWHFTTITDGASLTVTITKPVHGMFYLNDAERLPLSGNNTIVYGKITITANVTSNTDVVKVEFSVDGKYLGNDTSAPYEWPWKPVIQFNSALSLKRTITVKAFDSEGNNATANITITKWRFHPLPWILAGMAVASRFVLHTTVVGIFYNVQESRFSVSFYAIQAHYKTIGPFQMRKGNIHFKPCSGGKLIGPSTLTKLGPFHKFAIGSFTFIGNVNADKIGIGGSLLSRILQRRSA